MLHSDFSLKVNHLNTSISKNIKSWTPGLKDVGELVSKIEKLLIDDMPKQAQQLASCIENSEASVFKKVAQRWPEVSSRVQRKLVRYLVKGWMTRDAKSCVDWLVSELSQIVELCSSNKTIAYEQQLMNGLANAASLNLVTSEHESKLIIGIREFLEHDANAVCIKANDLTRLEPWLDTLSRFKSADALDLLEKVLPSDTKSHSSKTELWLSRIRANVTEPQGSKSQALSFETWLSVIESWLNSSIKHRLMFKVIPGFESFFKDEYKSFFDGAILTSRGVLVGKPLSKKIKEVMTDRFYLEVGLLIESPKTKSTQPKFDWLIELSSTVEQLTAAKAPLRIRMGDFVEIKSEKEKVQKSLLELYPHVVVTGRGAHWQIDFESALNAWSLFPKTKICSPKETLSVEAEAYSGKSQESLAWFLSKLAKRHVKLPTNRRLEILDPFCGTGTELLCANDTLVGKSRISLTGLDLSDQAIDIVKTRIQTASSSGGPKVSADEPKMVSTFVCTDAIDFLKKSHRKFDLIITNPPFGIRSSRGVARDLMKSFFENVSEGLADEGVLVIVAHAASSFVSWGSSSGLKLLASYPLLLGKMKVEAQVWTKLSQRSKK